MPLLLWMSLHSVMLLLLAAVQLAPHFHPSWAHYIPLQAGELFGYIVDRGEASQLNLLFVVYQLLMQCCASLQAGELFDYIVEKGRLLEDEARHFFQQVRAEPSSDTVSPVVPCLLLLWRAHCCWRTRPATSPSSRCK